MSWTNHKDKLLFDELRQKYETQLDTIESCQKILINLLRESKGDIIANISYHVINERCQEMILEEEASNSQNAGFYRKRQDRIEKIADRHNHPKFPDNMTKIKERIDVFLKGRYCQKSPKRCYPDCSKNDIS
jgi:hypothetical protein